MGISNWLFYVTIAFFTLIIIVLILLYTEFGKKFRRRYPKFFVQPEEDDKGEKK